MTHEQPDRDLDHVRDQIRELLTAKRSRLNPAQVGLPSYTGTRRVPGLRREEVAMLAGISFEYYTRLERGNASGASDRVLEGIAHALQLDPAERCHLNALVRTAHASRPRDEDYRAS